jgi:hypothetical protein
VVGQENEGVRTVGDKCPLKPWVCVPASSNYFFSQSDFSDMNFVCHFTSLTVVDCGSVLASALALSTVLRTVIFLFG